MINKKYAVAMTELLYFLKGFSKEELEKIPSSLLKFFEENCDKEYECKFDYNDELDKLKLKNETYGLISLICYNFWCESPEEKKNYLNMLNENEKKFQNQLRKIYDPNNIFKK